MQKEIPTLLQAWQKHLYEMHPFNAAFIWPARRLVDELLFKTESGKAVKREGKRGEQGNDAQ
ncbi:hypothetical protein ACB316_00470 [Aeromonas sanarellii]